jgi:hypothetical protein
MCNTFGTKLQANLPGDVLVSSSTQRLLDVH